MGFNSAFKGLIKVTSECWFDFVSAGRTTQLPDGMFGQVLSQFFFINGELLLKLNIILNG